MNILTLLLKPGLRVSSLVHQSFVFVSSVILDLRAAADGEETLQDTYVRACGLTGLLQPLPAGKHGASAEARGRPGVRPPSCGGADLLQAGVSVAPVGADVG